MFGGDADDVNLQASEAVLLFGKHAAELFSNRADALFEEGDVLGAFHCRLVVFAISEIEAGTGKA